MAWSYSKDPSGSPLDKVRFLIGDTDGDDPLLEDEEIQSMLVDYPVPLQAAIECCESVVARMARRMDNELGPIKEKAEQVYNHYVALEKKLRTRSSTYAVGAISDNTHTSIFTVGMMNDK